jgi:hypothetical protein
MTAVLGRRALAVLIGLGLALAAGCGKQAPETGKDSAAPVAGPPRIASAEPSFNAGKVKQGENVEHVFKIKNEGGSALVLEKAKSS